MKTRQIALAAWLAGYAAIVAGVLGLAGVPAAASGGNASVILLGFMGLGQVLWGTSFALRQSARLEWIGLGVNAAAVAIASLGAAAPSGPAAVDLLRIVLSLAAMALAAYLLTRAGVTGSAPRIGARTVLYGTGIVLGSSLLLATIWFGASGLPLLFLTPDADRGGANPTPTVHAAAHSEETGHMGTYRVRLTGVQAGPYFVQAFTGPTEVGDLFVEVNVRDAAGAIAQDLAISVEASAADGSGISVGGSATTDGAQVPGNYAIHLPVSSSGFWDVRLTIDGQLGHGAADFAERIGGTANIAMWVLAGVPLAVALLFGFVYLRTAGRRRS